MQSHELREFVLKNVPMDMINVIPFWERIKLSSTPGELQKIETFEAEKRKKALEKFIRRSKGKDLSWDAQVRLIEKIAREMCPSDGMPNEERAPIYEGLLEYLCPEIKPGDWKRALTR